MRDELDDDECDDELEREELLELFTELVDEDELFTEDELELELFTEELLLPEDDDDSSNGMDCSITQADSVTDSADSL